MLWFQSRDCYVCQHDGCSSWNVDALSPYGILLDVFFFFFFFFFFNCIAHNYLLFTQVSLQYLFTQVTLQYLTNSLNINRNYSITQLIHTHSDTHTHEQITAKSHLFEPDIFQLIQLPPFISPTFS